MADIDFSSLLQNPLFLGGVAGLLANPADRAQALIAGVGQASRLKSMQQQQQLDQLKINALQNQQAFNPSDYMQTAPVQNGSALPTALQNQMGGAGNQMPAALSGPIGQTQQIGNVAPQSVQPEPGTPTGQVDMQGLLQGGLSAGFTPQGIQQIAGIMDPATAARQALLTKQDILPAGSMVTNGLGQVVANNPNLPPGSPAATLQQLTAARDQYPVGSAQYNMLDTAVQKQSGQLEALQNQRSFDATQAQRDFTQGMQRQQFDQRQQQQVQQQAAQFSNNLQKAGIPAMQQQLDTIDSILDKHKGTSDEVPGYGRVEGAIPGMFLSGDAQELRQSVQSLANVILKTRSGSAVTEPEQKRFIIELGSGAWMPQERLLQGLKMMRGIVNSEKANAAAGASNDVLDAYSATPGAMDFTGYKRPSSAPGQGGASSGGVSIQNATAQDIAAAIARKKAGQ